MDTTYEARETTNRMRLTAGVFLENLRPEQRVRAVLSLDDELERRDWDFVPKYGRNGIPFRDLDHRQQTLAHQLIATGVSTLAYSKVVSIMAMEHVLRELQKDRMGLSTTDMRNPGNYFLSFFGWPNHEVTWGWRLVGHHISLNFTVVNGSLLSATPLLLGQEPAGYGALRPLSDEEDLGFALLDSLSEEQQRIAVIHPIAPPDFVTRVVPKLGQEERPEIYELGFDHYRISEADRDALKWTRDKPGGIAGRELSDIQMARLEALVECYMSRFPSDVAALEMERLQQDGLDRLHFAWAGERQHGRPHYYRLQGSSLLVELDNTQASGNHIHTVVRSALNDFGDDILRHHYEESHPSVRYGRVTSTRE